MWVFINIIPVEVAILDIDHCKALPPHAIIKQMSDAVDALVHTVLILGSFSETVNYFYDIMETVYQNQRKVFSAPVEPVQIAQ